MTMTTETTTQPVKFNYDIYHSGVLIGTATYEEANSEAVKKYFVEEEGHPHDIVVVLVKDRK